MTRLPLVVHERQGIWARQLRPRLVSWPLRVVETRSVADLVSGLGQSVCPLVVIDVGKRPRPALEAVDATMNAAPSALVLLIDTWAQSLVGPLARELGATHVLKGAVPPPAVAALLARWIPLALHRAEAEGWSAQRHGEPEAWDALLVPRSSFDAAPARA
jgi:hypothetical protein